MKRLVFGGIFKRLIAAQWGWCQIQATKNKVCRDIVRMFSSIASEKEIFKSVAIQSKYERIDVRASTPVKLLLQEAACFAHMNVSEFLLII